MIINNNNNYNNNSETINVWNEPPLSSTTNYPSKLACCRTFGPILLDFPSSLLFYFWIQPWGVCDLDQILPLQFIQFNLRDDLIFVGHFILQVLLFLFELTLALCYGIRLKYLEGTFYSSGYPSNIVCQEMKLTNLILQWLLQCNLPMLLLPCQGVVLILIHIPLRLRLLVHIRRPCTSLAL